MPRHCTLLLVLICLAVLVSCGEPVSEPTPAPSTTAPLIPSTVTDTLTLAPTPEMTATRAPTPEPTATRAPTPEPTATRAPTPTQTATPLPEPTIPLTSSPLPTLTPVEVITTWTQFENLQVRLAEVYAHYDSAVARIDECGLQDSVLDQATNDPDVMSGLNQQWEAQQSVVSAQSNVKGIDLDNPGKEGYVLLFDLVLAWNDYFRATRDLLEAEGRVYEAHGCAMPPSPDWLTAL